MTDKSSCLSVVSDSKSDPLLVCLTPHQHVFHKVLIYVTCNAEENIKTDSDDKNNQERNMDMLLIDGERETKRIRLTLRDKQRGTQTAERERARERRDQENEKSREGESKDGGRSQ